MTRQQFIVIALFTAKTYFFNEAWMQTGRYFMAALWGYSTFSKFLG